MIRVLLADDQRLVREGLGTLLGLLDGVELVGTAADGQEALDLAAQLDPDIVLMDLSMPRLNGTDAIRRLTERGPRPRAIALTTYADDASVLGALRAGARGYLTKDAGADEIRAAMEAVARGGERHGLLAVRRGTDELDAVEQPEQRAEALADHALVVGEHHADHAGSHSSTLNPSPVGPALSLPPSSSARSRMPVRP